jgi:hypothetical protein
MTEDTHTQPTRKISPRGALIAAALLAVGVGGGATVAQMTTPSVEMAPLKPVAIRSLTDTGDVVTVRGKVAEIYGPMFVLADGTGRTLVEGGREVDGTNLVATGQTVSVQGRFGRGMMHPSFLVGAIGKVTALRPRPPHGGPGGPGGPDRGPHGPGGPAGPDGPDARDAAPPPPPAAALGAAPGTAPAAPPAAGSGAVPAPATGVAPIAPATTAAPATGRR